MEDDGTLRAAWRRLTKDYAYVLPGFPLALFGFVVLVPLTVASIATLVVWVGVLLLPLTLRIATGFAQLSRSRLRAWGLEPGPVSYRVTGRGVRGLFASLSDPRRWLDLVFETLVAFPMRLTTFVVTVTWTVAGLGGLTFALWAWALPGEPAWIQLLELLLPSAAPEGPLERYLLSATINVVLGAVLLLTLPTVVRGLARVDATVTAALLGGSTGADAGPGAEAPAADRAPDGDPGTAFSGRAWSYLGVGFPAFVLVAVGWPVTAAIYQTHPALAMALTVGHAAAIVLAVRWPAVGIGLAAVATLGMMLTTAGAPPTLPWPWPVTTIIAHCVLVLILALRVRWLWAAGAWTMGALLTVAAPVLVGGGMPDGGIANGVVLLSVSGGVGLLGALIRLWVLSAGRVERAETVSAQESHRRRELQERNRIARDLHDVVAHSMSVINVQATTARYRKPDIDESVQQEFAEIAESSRRALNEMRALLGILRDDEDAPTAPAPGLADIADLVRASRASGASIGYSGQVPAVTETVGLTAFRVVQEALSNALRHAPGSAVQVSTQTEGQWLLVQVRNSAPESDRHPVRGSGLGLAGIRERVTTVGGTVEAGPTPEGGFAVVASLPLGAH